MSREWWSVLRYIICAAVLASLFMYGFTRFLSFTLGGP